MCLASRLKETRSTAVTPPKRLTTRSISRMDGISVERADSAATRRRLVSDPWKPRLDGPGEVVLLLEDAEDAAGHEEDDGDDDGTEEELVDIDEAGPDHLLQREEQDRSQDGSPDGALAAEEHHDDHRDGHDEREHRDRLDVALVARGEAADDARADGRKQKGGELVAEGVDPHRLGGDLVLADGHQAEAEARGDDDIGEGGHGQGHQSHG